MNLVLNLILVRCRVPSLNALKSHVSSLIDVFSILF